MNLLEANFKAGIFEYIFADWAVALFIFFAVLILLAVLFKGLKVGITLLVIFAVLAGLGVLTALVFMILTWDILRIIDFAIRWGPTILFVTIVTVSTLVNAKRGLRKSLILLVQAIVACTIVTIFYYICINSEDTIDRTMLEGINLFLGKGGLQKAMGVSAECSSLREALAEWLPHFFGGDIKILLAENPNYIMTLADMIFRIAIALIALVSYFLLVFLLYIVYFFAYPERRHKKKVNRAVTKNQTDRTYKKHHIGGGAVGLARGVTVGLLSLSFIGSAFFMVAGGLGQGTLGDYDFDNDDYNFYYSIYRSVESYGSQGIFKVLNTMTDSSDTPFYLFAADMVLSGTLDDEENDIFGDNIKFRKEIAAYTGFARETLRLLMKYGEEDIVEILNGRGGSNAFDKIVNIMTIPGFRKEFDVLIADFDSQTYVINFGYSLVNTIVEHIDEVSFTSSLKEDNKELIKLLFKKDYLSERIPDELKLKQGIEAGTVDPEKVEARPRLKVSHMLDKSDIRIALEVTLSILSGEQDTKDRLALVKALLPEIKQLSILKTSRSAELDPVLARLYCYVENRYLTAEDEEGITYAEVKGKDVKWLTELNALVEVADDAINLWKNIYEEQKTALDMILWAFDKDNPDRADNEIYFDNICNTLEVSKLASTAMSTSYMYKMMKKALADVSENVYIPKDLEYSNTQNADGSVTFGELHQFFCGFRILIKPDYSDVLHEILDFAKGAEIELSEFLSSLSDVLEEKDKYGRTLSYYLTESSLLRSIISISLMENGKDTLYIPTVSLDKLADGTAVNIINKRELKQLFDNITLFVDLLEPAYDEDSDYIAKISGLIEDEEFNALLAENRIVEGTVAKILSGYIKDNQFIVVPVRLLNDFDGWVTVNGRQGELRNLLDALKAVDLDIVKIANGEFETGDLFDMLLELETGEVNKMLSSQILHYTLSKHVIDGTETGGFKLIVPTGARERTQEGDSIEYIVRKAELLNLFSVVAKFELSGDELEISPVLQKLVANKKELKESLIMSASIVYTIVNNDDVKSSITLPEKYLVAGSEEALLDYNKSNVWNDELPHFIDALDEILGISEQEDFVFNSDSIKDSLSGFLKNVNEESRVKPPVTKLELCYNSDIVWNELTVRLDETLLDNDIAPAEVLDSAKSRGTYTLEEVKALSSALDIFGIDDILNMDGEDLISNVTGMAFSLNDPIEKYDNQTGLEVIYNSKIIQYVFSNELDKALEGAIEASVVSYIKNGRSTYPRQDVADLIDAARELEIADFDSISDLDFASVKDLTDASHLDPESGRSRLNVIYTSRIAAGVITKSLRESLNSGDISEYDIDHPLAYQEGTGIYKEGEIEAIYEVFCKSELVGSEGEGEEGEDDGNESDGKLDFDLSKIDLKQVSAYLYDETADIKTRSYLLAAAISAVIKDNESLIIPVDVIDEYGCVRPSESALVIWVFGELYEGQSLDDMEEWEITTIPSGEARDKMFASEIMRACVTYNLGIESDNVGRVVCVSGNFVKDTIDTTGFPILIISEIELHRLADALDVLSDGSVDTALEIHDFEFDELMGYDEETIEKLLASDVMYYKICECLMADVRVQTYITMFQVETSTHEVINLFTYGKENRSVIERETIREIISYYKNITGRG